MGRHPLALHGVIVRKTGEKVIINIGEDENDPVFCISDLLVHLAQEQMAKNAKEVVEGEALNLIVGGRPLEGEEKDAVKANVLKLLADKYGVEEEDFSAELEIVPAGKARDMGFDRSMILGYGHDDRVCAYPSMMAVLDYEGTPDYTSAASSPIRRRSAASARRAWLPTIWKTPSPSCMPARRITAIWPCAAACATAACSPAT